MISTHFSLHTVPQDAKQAIEFSLVKPSMLSSQWVTATATLISAAILRVHYISIVLSWVSNIHSSSINRLDSVGFFSW